MEIEQLRKEINQLLDNIVDHSERYAGSRHLPSLEISFVLSKVNKMQERMIVLKHLVEENENNVKLNNEKKTHDVVADSSLPEDVQVQPEPFVADPAEEESPIEEESPVEEIDVPEDNERIAAVSENLEQPTISKLIDALTLNDRYLYANELFDKDMNAFNDLVKSIDNSASINEAKELLMQLNWDDENEHVLSFILLVEQRFN